MVAWVVIDRQYLRQAAPFAFRLSTPLFPLPPLSPLLPYSYALFSATAVSQPFAYQSLPHSFHRDGGCTPSSSIPLSHYAPKSFPHNLLSNPHPLNPCATILYKNGGGKGGPTPLQQQWPELADRPGRIPSSFQHSTVDCQPPLCPSRITDPRTTAHLHCKSFSCNTYASPASVANKRLTARLTSLDATLTKNMGRGLVPILELATRHSSLATTLKSFMFIFLRTLLHFFALTQNSTLFFSSDSALFVQNTRGGGRGQRWYF